MFWVSSLSDLCQEDGRWHGQGKGVVKKARAIFNISSYNSYHRVFEMIHEQKKHVAKNNVTMEAPGIDGQSPKVITSCIWSYISCALWRSRRNFRRKVIALQSKPFSSTQSVSFGKSSLAWSWSPRIVGGTNRARLAQGANPAIQEIVQFGHLKHPTILNNFKSEFIYTAITTCVTLKHHSGLCLCWPVKTCIEPCAANDFSIRKSIQMVSVSRQQKSLVSWPLGWTSGMILDRKKDYDCQKDHSLVMLNN